MSKKTVLSEIRIKMVIDMDKEKFLSMTPYNQMLILADYIYESAEAEELEFEFVNESQEVPF